VFHTGQILVSHPRMSQGIFSKSVVLLTEVSTKGTLGVILNKPSEYKLGEILGENLHQILSDETLYRGGPVGPNSLLILHTGEWYSSNTLPLPINISMSSDHFMFEKINMGNLPNRYKFLAGMSSWTAGQLEEEIQRDTWLVCETDEDFIFEHTGLSMWKKAVEMCASQSIANYF